MIQSKLVPIIAASLSASVIFSFGDTPQDTSTRAESIYNISQNSDLSLLNTIDATVSYSEASGKGKLKVAFSYPGGNYPSVRFMHPAETRNLSAFKGLRAEVKNLGDKAFRVAIRVDNFGDITTRPWNTGGAMINPGETTIIQVTFGKDGDVPGFPLETKQVSNITIFANSPPPNSSIEISYIKGF